MSEIAPESGCTGSAPAPQHRTQSANWMQCPQKSSPAHQLQLRASPSWADRNTDCSPCRGPAVVSRDVQGAAPRYKGDVPTPRDVPESAHPGGWQVLGTNKRGWFELFFFWVIYERKFCHVLLGIAC